MQKKAIVLLLLTLEKDIIGLNNQEKREIGATDLPNEVTREFSVKTACAVRIRYCAPFLC